MDIPENPKMRLVRRHHRKRIIHRRYERVHRGWWHVKNPGYLSKNNTGCSCWIVDQNTPFQKALDAVESLPLDAREEVVEIIKMRLAEDRREEIAANAREAVSAVRESRANCGTIEDLKKDLLGG